MSLITRMLQGKAVYWPPLLDDNDEPTIAANGQVVFDDPVQIKCRWTDESVEFLDKGGNTQISKAVVYVDRVCAFLGVLWEGVLNDLVSETDPFANSGAWEIRGKKDIKNLRQTETCRKCFL